MNNLGASTTRRRVVSVLGILAVICVFGFVYNLGKMSSGDVGSSRSLKSVSGANGFGAERIETLSWSPRVFHFHGFLSPEECDHIVALGANDLERSQVVGKDGKSVTNTARTSYGTFMTRYMSDHIVSAVEERIAEWTFLPKENGEIFYLLRYENGQEYKPHTDWFPRNEDGAHYIGRAGQRIATVLMYLSNVDEGGDTYFPRANLQVHPKKGDAVLFWNSTPDHKDDDMSLHGSKPVITGTKWSLTRWIREKPMH